MATLVNTAAADRGPGPGGNAVEIRVEGTVSAVNVSGGMVTITTKGASQVVVATNMATKIERNGARATLAAFRIGDRGQARINSTTKMANKLEATGP